MLVLFPLVETTRRSIVRDDARRHGAEMLKNDADEFARQRGQQGVQRASTCSSASPWGLASVVVIQVFPSNGDDIAAAGVGPFAILRPIAGR